MDIGTGNAIAATVATAGISSEITVPVTAAGGALVIGGTVEVAAGAMLMSNTSGNASEGIQAIQMHQIQTLQKRSLKRLNQMYLGKKELKTSQVGQKAIYLK